METLLLRSTVQLYIIRVRGQIFPKERQYGITVTSLSVIRGFCSRMRNVTWGGNRLQEGKCKLSFCNQGRGVVAGGEI